jgi:hypothetical protein
MGNDRMELLHSKTTVTSGAYGLCCSGIDLRNTTDSDITTHSMVHR